MGTFIESGFMPGLSGKVAGSVFQRNKYGRFVRNKTIPTNPQTVSQQEVRLNVSDLSKTWGTLTEAQRQNWIAEAQNYPLTKKGRTYTLAGYMYFMMLNRNLQEIDQPVITDCPPIGKPQKFDFFSVNITTTPGTEDIKLFISAPVDAGTKIKLYSTRHIKPGVYNFSRKLNKIGVIDSTFITGGSIKSLYLAKYGTLPGTGDKVYFAIQPTLVDSGATEIRMTTMSIGTI